MAYVYLCVSNLWIGAALEPPLWLWTALGIAYRVRREKPERRTRLSGMPFNERVKENEPGKYREAKK